MLISSDVLAKCHAATGCHMCESRDLRLVLDLGMHPHSDDFLSADRLDEPELLYPLRLVSCADCGLLQIDYFVDPDILYRTNYVYQSSTTKNGRDHYRLMATDIAKRLAGRTKGLAVDIGSNVGVLLDGFKAEGFNVLGVDPAQAASGIANEKGLTTINDFFNKKIVERILSERGPAQVITGTNVFAHLHQLTEATEAMARLLAKDGMIVIEAPYAIDMIEHVEYDTIYHQHIAYLSVKPMRTFFASRGLELFDVEPQTIHGGTLRYFVQHKNARPISASVATYVTKEEVFGLYSEARLAEFACAAFAQRTQLTELLLNLKKSGKRIVGVSAPAKGNTLLNFCHIDTFFLEYITERNPLKVGLYTPATHVPIKDDSILKSETPDFALLLAWNFADEIMANLKEYQARGGSFIIPVPKPTLR